jgi:uncharacterized protein YbjT (DUF2867 family)
MNVLVTGVTGYVGALVAAALHRDGHHVRGLSRRGASLALTESPRARAFTGDALTGAGLAAALDGVEVAYYLIHSMEPSASDASLRARERLAAERFAAAAANARVRRLVYLGGLVPAGGPRSEHLRSRMEVEHVLRASVPDTVVLRASIVIGAGSRSFRFLVRLVERLPVMAIPAWRIYHTAPIDERDVTGMLVAAADCEAVAGLTLDAGGPDLVSYGELIDMIAELMVVNRPSLRLRRLTLTPIASRLAAAVAGERPELIEPLMQSLDGDLIPRDDRAALLLGVRLHSLRAAIERALRIWEETEPLAAR